MNNINSGFIVFNDKGILRSTREMTDFVKASFLLLNFVEDDTLKQVKESIRKQCYTVVCVEKTEDFVRVVCKPTGKNLLIDSIEIREYSLEEVVNEGLSLNNIRVGTILFVTNRLKQIKMN